METGTEEHKSGTHLLSHWIMCSVQCTYINGAGASLLKHCEWNSGVLPEILFQWSSCKHSVMSQGLNIHTARGQNSSFTWFINWICITTASCWAVKTTLLYVNSIGLWRSSGKHYALFHLIKFLPFFPPLLLYLTNCLFLQILACAILIPLAVLSWRQTA